MARIRILPAISRFLGLTVIADIDILTTPITGMTRKVNGRGGTGKTFLKVTDWTGVIFAHTFNRRPIWRIPKICINGLPYPAYDF